MLYGFVHCVVFVKNITDKLAMCSGTVITRMISCMKSAISFSITARLFTIATISEQSNKTAHKISSKIKKKKQSKKIYILLFL